MGIFDYFFKAAPAESTESGENEAAVKYDGNNSMIFNDNKVLAINDNKEDDGFVQIDFRKLSYAEVAALKDGKSKKSGQQHDEVIDINKDLGRDITDYQLAEAIQKQLDARDLQEAIEVSQKNAFVYDDSPANKALMDFSDKFEHVAETWIKKSDKRKRRKGKLYSNVLDKI